MATVEQLLISKVLAEQTLEEASKRGVTPAHFGSYYADAWEFISEHTLKHGAVPSERQFALAHSDIPLEDASTETFSGLVEELYRQHRIRVLSDATAKGVDALDKGDPALAQAVYTKALEESSASGDVLTDTDLVLTWEERYERYKTRASSDRKLHGCATGFNTLDELTGGFTGPNYILFVGEPKRGKSLYSLISAQAAHMFSNKKVLYLSFEMGYEEVAGRYDALNAGVSYNDMMSGRLNEAGLERVREEGLLRKYRPPFILSEDSYRLTTVQAVRAKIVEHQPDIVFIDGQYMMSSGDPRHDERTSLTHITRGTKMLAQEFQIPIVGTTQVLASKVTTSARRIEAHAIGYTGSFAQDADLILGCELDTDTPNQSIIRIVEGRNVPKDVTIKVKGDWDHMHFYEVGPGGDEEDEDEGWDRD